MTGILKVDTIQKNDGSTPTAADLGLNIGGNVLQILQSQDTYTTTYTSSAFTDMTNLSVTITPRNANSKFLLKAHLSICINNQNYSAAFRFTRNGTPVGIGDQVGSNRPRASFMTAQIGGGDHVLTVSQEYLDSPSTTSSITYKVQGFAESGDAFITNRAYNSSSDSNNAKHAVATCNLIVMEIAG
jgi:hypothetical protein